MPEISEAPEEPEEPEQPTDEVHCESAAEVCSPSKDWYRQKARSSEEQVNQLRKKVKILHQTKRRLAARCNTSRELVKELREKKLLSERGLEVFEASFSPDIQQLLDRATENTSKKYPPELRAFALTLHFYSPAAYEYVRAKFNNALPAQRTLREWYRAVNGEPGFTSEAFALLESVVKGRDEPVYAALMVDDMSIKKHVQLVGNKVVGYVDLGTGLTDDSLPEATNACVFMLVALNMRLKVPLGYFLIESLSGPERADLVKECISRVSSAGVEVVSLTFDGAASNFTMAKSLGADLSYHSSTFSTSFKHPTEPSKEVFVVLDACHMIKLIRNCLGSVSHLTDLEGSPIKWSYIEALEALQREEGLHLGNKLTKVHLAWEKQKMKVRLAVQTLSSSVADALDFCEFTLKLPQFQGAHATAKFIRIFDRLFDLLNSRNPLARSYKAAMRKGNAPSWKAFLKEAEEYIRNLKDANGRFVIDGQKKTGFLGLIICMNSVAGLFAALVVTDKLNYLLTHKMSQDHLETFFGCVRGRGGFNNNPTACQFKAAYKRLLVQTEVKSSDAGNCSQDVVTVFSLSTAIDMAQSPATVTSQRRSTVLEPLDDEHDYTHRVDFPKSLSGVVNSVVPYIAGFVATRVAATTHCEECVAALHSSELTGLIRAKSRGGLVAPSKDVLQICEAAEKGLRVLQAQCKNLRTLHAQCEHLVGEILATVIERAWFSQLEPHLFDCDPLDNHIYNLSKKVAQFYLKIRIHHISKEINRGNCKERVRTLLSRLIIFQNQ